MEFAHAALLWTFANESTTELTLFSSESSVQIFSFSAYSCLLSLVASSATYSMYSLRVLWVFICCFCPATSFCSVLIVSAVLSITLLCSYFSSSSNVAFLFAASLLNISLANLHLMALLSRLSSSVIPVKNFSTSVFSRSECRISIRPNNLVFTYLELRIAAWLSQTQRLPCGPLGTVAGDQVHAAN